MPEFDFPQFELTLHYDEALKATDDIFLFRLMAREVAMRKGYYLCFMPKPIADKSGSGVHINISFTDKNTGKNMIYHDDGSLGVAKQAIAGMLHHHKGLAALLNPITNSYRRSKPASLAAYWANWGIDHRSTTVRLSPKGASARIEHRMADSAANPYVALAALLQASKLGLDNDYTLFEEEKNDGLETVNTTKHMADNLSDALKDLQKDMALSQAIGQGLVDNFIDIKQAEIEKIDDNIDSEFQYYHPFI